MIIDLKSLRIHRTNLINIRCLHAAQYLKFHKKVFNKLLENVYKETKCDQRMGESSGPSHSTKLQFYPGSLIYRNNKYLLSLLNAETHIALTPIEIPKRDVIRYAKSMNFEFTRNKNKSAGLTEAKGLLKNKNVGTFLLHRRKTSDSLFLSYVNPENVIKHVQYFFRPEKELQIICNIRDVSQKYLKYEDLQSFIKHTVGNTVHCLNTTVSPNYVEKTSRTQHAVSIEYPLPDVQLPGSIYVGEEEYGDAGPQSINPIIGTMDYTTCIAILIYHKEKSCVIHARGINDNIKQCLHMIIEQVFGKEIFNKPESLVATLAGNGGWGGEKGYVRDDVKQFFDDNKIPYNTELLHSNVDVIALDSRNGNIIAMEIPDPILARIANVEKGKMQEEKKAKAFFLKTVHNGEIAQFPAPYVAYIAPPNHYKKPRANALQTAGIFALPLQELQPELERAGVEGIPRHTI